MFGSRDNVARGAPKEAEVREFDVEADDGRILHAYDAGRHRAQVPRSLARQVMPPAWRIT